MPTVEQRYAAATSYVRRAITTVEDRGVVFAVDPVTGFVEWYASNLKTEQPRVELARIEARWLRATRDDERVLVARDAELLADRVEENLPGAPQDRIRTNLRPGETPTFTPPTTYYGEVAAQSREAWAWLKDKASGADDGAVSVGKLLLVGGGVAAGWKLLDYLRERERARIRSSSGRTRRALNTSLERAALRRR